MSEVTAIYNVVQHLQPDMREFAENSQYMRWCDYADVLDGIIYLCDNEGVGEVVLHINDTILKSISTSVEHEVCTDVASTLESLYPALFAGKFKY